VSIGGPKILLVGASGQVGGQIYRLLPPKRTLITGRTGSPTEIPLDLAALSTSADTEHLLAGHEISAIYCIAGMTAVDLCEEQPEVAQAINCTGPLRLAEAASCRSIPFVFFSTEYVFDGIDGPYNEDSLTNPLSVYGRSKRDGEQAVLDAYLRALVIRTTVVYGPDRPRFKGGKQNNYLYSVVRNLTHGTSMRVPIDQISTPSYNCDVARVTVDLVARGATGIYHVCGPEMFGRLEFAHSIAAEWGLDASLLHGVSTASLKQKAARPLNAGLLTDKLRKNHPDLRMRTLKEALADCRREVLAAVP